MLKVVDNAVKVAYEGMKERLSGWRFIAEKKLQLMFMHKDTWLPDETIDALKRICG